jgi:hypothetical protein
MNGNTKKFIDTCCKMTMVLKPLCENECIFRDIKLKRFTCKIIPKDNYCVRPLCHDFFKKQTCQCKGVEFDNDENLLT